MGPFSLERLGWLAVASGFLCGCDAAPFGSNDLADEAGTGSEASLDGSYWRLSDATDPFSDETSSTMTTVIEGSLLDTEVVVKCVGGSRLSYRLSTFKKNGRPQKISRFPNSTELQLLNPVKMIVFRVRIDDQASETGVFPEPRNSNSFLIGRRTTLGGPKADELRTGDTLTFGIQFDGGEEVVVIDQTHRDFRDWINGCSSDVSSDSLDDTQPSVPEDSDDLTYQEQLQGSGEVDGRSKDYFTADGDTEFGGAVVGMGYDDFSDRLKFAGFSPLALSSRWRCQSDAGFDADCDYQYPKLSPVTIPKRLFVVTSGQKVVTISWS